MAYPYGPQTSPAVGNGLGGLPQRQVVAVPTVNNQDIYATKKVRLVKVGTQVSVSSTTTQLTNNGAPIPMGFGQFAISRLSTSIAVVDYSSAGISQVRSNATVSGRDLSNAVFRGSNGVGFWYRPSTSQLYRVTASGASSTANSLVATVSTLAASGTITNSGSAYTSLSLQNTSTAVSKYGNNLVHLGTANVGGTTKMVLVLVSLDSFAVTAVFDLGAPTGNSTLVPAMTVYKNIATVFWLNYDSTNYTVGVYPYQFNFQTYVVTALTTASGMSVTNSGGNTMYPVAYAANGAVWVDMWFATPRILYNYGFATDSSGVATDHAATTSFNGSTFYTPSVQFKPSFGEFNVYYGRVRDFDYNLVYGYDSTVANETDGGLKLAETVLLENDYRTQIMARARAPIAFMEASKRLPVSLSLVCAGSGDQTANTGSTSGYDGLLCYLDNGYWVLMTTDGDSGVPSYSGFLQLYKEA